MRTLMATRKSTRTVVCWALLLGLPLIAEGVLRALYTQTSHTFEQRQSEVYGWFAVACLLLVLVARPLKLIQQRRMLGVFAFLFSALHTWVAYRAVFDSDWESLEFLSKADQWATWCGVIALLGFVPLFLTSTNGAVRKMGKHWKTLHRLGPPLTLMAILHTLWMGVHFGLDSLTWTSILLILLTLVVYIWRYRKDRTP